MSDTIYQVYFTNEKGQRAFLNESFSSESDAREAVVKLIGKGFEDADYEGFSFDIGDDHESSDFSRIHRGHSSLT